MFFHRVLTRIVQTFVKGEYMRRASTDISPVLPSLSGSYQKFFHTFFICFPPYIQSFTFFLLSVMKYFDNFVVFLRSRFKAGFLCIFLKMKGLVFVHVLNGAKGLARSSLRFSNFSVTPFSVFGTVRVSFLQTTFLMF